MKNPNGFGSCYKLSGKRRKPYIAIVPDGRDEDGRLLRKIIGYYATRKEGLEALSAYSADPYAITSTKTFAEIYDGWHADTFHGDYSLTREHNYSVAYSKCKKYHDAPFVSVRLQAIQSLCDDAPSYDAAYRIKILINQMSQWAIDRDYASKNYSGGVVIKQKKGKVEKRRFTNAEIKKVFALDSRMAKLIQVFLYTGCRRGELLNLQREDCHIDEHYFYIRQAKTENGIRVVPIHDCIYETVKTFYNENHPYVFSTAKGLKWGEDNWTGQLREFSQAHGIHHTTHETRHTFISLATVYELNQTMLKKIVGHVTEQSLTERVYTHITIAQLLEAVNKIPSPSALPEDS